MESAELLDILGNENRRKILSLLAVRPCYMSEIAQRLEVGAKAILGHLEILEQAGLIESSTDNRRRKYFHITDNLRLEVFVSPYSFEIETTTITAINTQKNLIKNQPSISELKSLYNEISELLKQRHQLMEEYKKIQSVLTEAMGMYMDVIDNVANNHIEAEILYILLKGELNKRMLSIQSGIPEYVLEEYLEKMEREKLIKEENNNYSIDY